VFFARSPSLDSRDSVVVVLSLFFPIFLLRSITGARGGGVAKNTVVLSDEVNGCLCNDVFDSVLGVSLEPILRVSFRRGAYRGRDINLIRNKSVKCKVGTQKKRSITNHLEEVVQSDKVVRLAWSCFTWKKDQESRHTIFALSLVLQGSLLANVLQI
jgi:hypothetical protein